jgi:hypothetical protein
MPHWGSKRIESATRSCVNKGLIRALTSRSEDGQSSSVASIDAPAIYDLPIMAASDGENNGSGARHRIPPPMHSR